NRLLDPTPENNNYRFDGVSDVAVDGEGRIYMVDRGNHRIQIFDGEGTYLYTLGVKGKSGCDHNTFSYPCGIHVHGERVYVADTYNHRIQIFDLDGGYVYTLGIVGQAGPGDDAFDSPKDVAMGDDGRIYVADYGNHRIQIFDGLDDSIADDTIGITGVSGTNNSVFNLPYGIAVEGNKIYVSDSGNHRIQIFDGLDDSIADDTIGQTGTLGYSDEQLFYPYGIDVVGGKVHVADHKNHRIQIFGSNFSLSDTIGFTREFGSGNTYLNNPGNVAVTSQMILVADYENHRVQIFDPEGNYQQTIGASTHVGTEHTDFNQPRDVAVGDDGRIYVADRNNHRIQIFDENYTYIQTLGTSGKSGDQHTHFNQPKDIDIGADRIAVADRLNNRIQFFDLDGNYLNTLKGEGNDPFTEPCGVKIDDENQRIYVADTYAENVRVYSFDLTHLHTIVGADPNYTEGGVPTGNITFFHPYDVEIGPNGLVYILDTNHQCIQVFHPGNYSYSHTIGGSVWDGTKWNGDLKWACGFDIVGNSIYIADTYNHRLQVINIDGSHVGTIGYINTAGADDEHFAKPRGVGVGADGKIYVADANNNRVQIYYSNRTFCKSLSTTGLAIFDNEHFNRPEGVSIDASHNIYVADSLNYRIQVYDAVGDHLFTLGSSTERMAGSDNEHLSTASGLAIGNDRIYVVDKGNSRIQVFHMDGGYDETLSIDCYGAAVGPDGYIYTAHAPNQCIEIYTTAGELVQTLGTTGVDGNDMEHLNTPVGVSVGDDGKVYVADRANHRIVIYDNISDHIADQVIGEAGVSGSDSAHLSSPQGVMCWNGNIYVADTGNQRVQIFDSSGQYLRTLGVTEKVGPDNCHFNEPSSVFADDDGKLYVADRGNDRVVKIVDVGLAIVPSETYVAPSDPSEPDPSEPDPSSSLEPWYSGTVAGIPTYLVLVLPLLLVLVLVLVLVVVRARRRGVSEDAGEPGMPLLVPGTFYRSENKDPDHLYETYHRITGTGVNGICISRLSPEKVMRQYDIPEEEIYWLSGAEGKQILRPDDSNRILFTITTFGEKNPEGTVLFEGLDNIASNIPHEDFLHFVEALMEIATTRHITIIAHTPPTVYKNITIAKIRQQTEPLPNTE
ncbi:MAG: 6-bladed beta-propeller, partial [Thermoplasmata archaeon]|nr:6-bladed beta-propeller [Thermoplasmata archaeon]